MANELEFKCLPTQRMHNKVIAKTLLRRAGLYMRDRKYLKVKKRILQKLGLLDQERAAGTTLSPRELELLTGDEGDRIVDEALEVWQEIKNTDLYAQSGDEEE